MLYYISECKIAFIYLALKSQNGSILKFLIILQSF